MHYLFVYLLNRTHRRLILIKGVSAIAPRSKTLLAISTLRSDFVSVSLTYI